MILYYHAVITAHLYVYFTYLVLELVKLQIILASDSGYYFLIWYTVSPPFFSVSVLHNHIFKMASHKPVFHFLLNSVLLFVEYSDTLNIPVSRSLYYSKDI